MTTVKSIHKGDEFYYLGAEAPSPLLGTVIALTSYAGKQIGLQFEEPMGGHTCDGRGPQGYCIWARPWDILTPNEYQAKLDADAAANAGEGAVDLDVLEL